jgi:hypothetical protein
VPIDDEQLWEIVLQGLEEVDATLPDDDEEECDGFGRMGRSLVETIRRAQADGAPSLIRRVVSECIALAEKEDRVDWESFERDER